MRSPYLLTLFPLLLLGCAEIPDDDRGYGIRGPAAIEQDRETILTDLRRACREGDRQSCSSLDRAVQEKQRQDRYEGPQPSLSERNRDQQRRDQERLEEKQRRLEQRPSDILRY